MTPEELFRKSCEEAAERSKELHSDPSVSHPDYVLTMTAFGFLVEGGGGSLCFESAKRRLALLRYMVEGGAR